MKLIDYISELRKSLPLDYQEIDDRMLIRLLNEFRSVFIKNESNKNNKLDDKLIQTISGIQLKIVDQSDTFFINTMDRILKTVVPIPTIIKSSHRDLIFNIRNAKILSDSYNIITKDNAIYSGNGKFNKNDIYCFPYNGYIYTKLNDNNPKLRLLTHISIEAIFENPLECIPFQYKGYYNELDYEYPLSDIMWGYIKSNILQHGLGIIKAQIEEKQ
jgi:hypothetical protein